MQNIGQTIAKHNWYFTTNVCFWGIARHNSKCQWWSVCRREFQQFCRSFPIKHITSLIFILLPMEKQIVLY